MNLREHLQGIYDSQGRLSPDLVVEVATAPEHPLHVMFEWDDTVAGAKYRLVQAAGLIRSVKISINRGPTKAPLSVRAFMAPREATEPQSYEPVEDIIQDPLRRQMMLHQMERDWRALYRRYAEFKEFWELVDQQRPA